MPQISSKPPDLDENLTPIKPPDLDENGNVIGDSNPLQMTYAIVNGQRIPLGGDEADLNPTPQSELTREEPASGAINFAQRLLQPIVDVSPETRQHMAEFEQVHPILGGGARNLLDLILGESSPLSLGLGAAGAAESVAGGMGMDKLANVMKYPSRIAGAGMMWHGASRIGEGETLGDKLGGGLETVLGGLAVRGPKGIETPVERLNKLTHESGLIESLDEPNQTLGRLHEMVASDPLGGEVSRPNRSLIPDEVNPKLIRETPITVEDLGFFKKFISETSGEVKLPDIKGGKVKRPLRALDELHDALIDASQTREDTEKLYKGERSKRFAAYDEPKPQGRKGFYEGLSRLKGPLPKEKFSPIEMNPNSARALYNEIERRTDLSTPDRIHASTGLGKILGDYKAGEVPQRNEIEAIRKVFGDPVADQLVNMHAGVPVTKAMLNETANLSKSLMSSYDASAPFRQGLGLIHTAEFWKNYQQMYGYMSREAYDGAMLAIHEDAMFAPLQKSGLRLTEIGQELGAREEQFASNLAGKIPIIGRGVLASERMYTGFLNKTRYDVAKRLMIEAEKSGLKPFIKNSAGEIVPTKLGREISEYVNNATGRGSLGRFEKNAVELNSLFFSPRLISSRLTMLNPMYYINATPFVRKQALKSLFAMATAGKIVEELGKAAGGTVDTSDPTSSDYHKVRIGNTRIDPYGGFQQYITAASRLLVGAYNSSTGNKDGMNLKTAAARTFGMGGRYPSMLENKLSPLAKFADDIMFGRPASDSSKNGNVVLNTLQIPHSAEQAKIANLFTPMIIQDIQDLWKEDPSLVPLGFLASQGMGVQTYSQDEKKNDAGFRQLQR